MLRAGLSYDPQCPASDSILLHIQSRSVMTSPNTSSAALLESKSIFNEFAHRKKEQSSFCPLRAGMCDDNLRQKFKSRSAKYFCTPVLSSNNLPLLPLRCSHGMRTKNANTAAVIAKIAAIERLFLQIEFVEKEIIIGQSNPSSVFETWMWRYLKRNYIYVCSICDGNKRWRQILRWVMRLVLHFLMAKNLMEFSCFIKTTPPKFEFWCLAQQ